MYAIFFLIFNYLYLVKNLYCTVFFFNIKNTCTVRFFNIKKFIQYNLDYYIRAVLYCTNFIGIVRFLYKIYVKSYSTK
jgi:hypothetical protein